MWEVIIEVWAILLVSAVIGMAIGYILSNILSTSKIEMLEEENWQLKEDLRKYRNSVTQLETSLQNQTQGSAHGDEKAKAAQAKYQAKIESLKSEISELKNRYASSDAPTNLMELQERNQALLSEREKLIAQLEALGQKVS